MIYPVRINRYLYYNKKNDNIEKRFEYKYWITIKILYNYKG